jgi:GH15 family glucan-1,4-alpha-glucosidase
VLVALPLEQYAFIGDMQTGALVGADGAIDWLCLPRFDSGACFAALLGTEEHGRWTIVPDGVTSYRRRYRGDSLVLETEFRTEDGVVRMVDCMPVRDVSADVVRRVEGVRGNVRMHSELCLRFDYGSIVPWHRRGGRRVYGIAGPDTAVVDADVELSIVDDVVRADFTVSAGQAVHLRLGWTGPRQPLPPLLDMAATVTRTEQWWHDWAARCTYAGPYRDAVIRSLITLKGLTYAPSGGIVAALTTSLPEQLGGPRNWDYRFCWIRDATYTLLVLLDAGYTEEAAAWREWLLRALAGRPEQMQIMYGIDGERRLTELELEWLPGYFQSRPVRIGNAASKQFQLDVYGELMDALHQSRVMHMQPHEGSWQVECALLDFLESHWRDPDEGIWEVRGPRRDFVHSKVMAWVAVDRAIKSAELFALDCPMPQWLQLRQDIFDEVCAKGFDASRGTFTQFYGSSQVDASLLLIAPVGFLPADDPRVIGTVASVERELCVDGYVLRYPHDAATSHVDGLPPGEGAFLACTFWLADNYVLQGRVDEARTVFERLLGLANDVGLLAEEYDPSTGRLVGNFPQAFSHLQLVNTALLLGPGPSPTRRRARTGNRP